MIKRLSLLLAAMIVASMMSVAPVFASGNGDWDNGDDHNVCWCDNDDGNHNGNHNGADNGNHNDDKSWCDDDNGDNNGNHNDDDDWSNGNHDDDKSWCDDDDDNGNGNGDDDDGDDGNGGS